MTFLCYNDPNGCGYEPEYATAGSAGMDVHSIERHILAPGERALVSTGVVAMLEDGFELQVRPRSGLAFKHGVTVLNAPGTIDSDYRGVIKVLLINHGQEYFYVNPGDRIAQLVYARVERAKFSVSYPGEYYENDNQLEREGIRGTGGFGSTGT